MTSESSRIKPDTQRTSIRTEKDKRISGHGSTWMKKNNLKPEERRKKQKYGILSDIESIHRVTIDRAVERKLKSSDFN